MNEPAQDTDDVEVQTQDAPEVIEEAAQETENEVSNDDVSQDEAQEVELTPEQKLEKLENDLEARQKKIDRQTAAYADLQKAHDRKMQELQQMQAQIKSEPAKQEPSIDDFDTYDEYVNAVADFRAEHKAKEYQQNLLNQQEQIQRQQMMQQRAQVVKEQEAEYLVQKPEYAASKQEFFSYVSNLEQVGALRPEIIEVITTQAHKGNVPQVIDYFGSNNGANLDELRNIANMTPVEAGIEIYKIQQKLASATPAKKETKPAPKPLDKPKGGSKSSKPISKMTGKELLEKFST